VAGPFPSSPAVVALGSHHRDVVDGFHFRILVGARALSVATGHTVLRLGRAGGAVGVGDGRVPLVGPFPSSPAVVALGSRHSGLVGGLHFRMLVCARALSVATGHTVLRLGRAGAAVGVGEERGPLVGSFPSSPAVVALGSRHRGVVGGFHFRMLVVGARALSVATGHTVLRVGRAGAAVGFGDGRVPLVGPFPSSPAVVALGSRHSGVVGDFHFRILVRARALSVATGDAASVRRNVDYARLCRLWTFDSA